MKNENNGNNGYLPSNNVNQGAVAIEGSKAFGEALFALKLAKQCPRDIMVSRERIMTACKRPALASEALYSYPRGGKTVSGPSIRLAEVLASNWGNLKYGIKELSQDEGKSEMLAFCWDLETNVESQQTFVNQHVRERGGKNIMLTSQRDIYELNANMGARRLRSRILAIIPPDIVEEAIYTCKQTIAGHSDLPLIDRITKMVTAFKKMGVSKEEIEKRLGRTIDLMTMDELIEFGGIFNSIKEGQKSRDDWFAPKKEVKAGDLTAELKKTVETKDAKVDQSETKTK